MQQDLPFARTHAAGGAQLILLDGQHPGEGVQHDDEERRVHDERDLRLLADAEPDEEQRDEGDGRNEPDKVEERFREDADDVHLADREPDRDRDQASQAPADENPEEADADVSPKRPVRDQLLRSEERAPGAGDDFRAISPRSQLPDGEHSRP